MAERRDYLLRMIEQMGAVFARIRQVLLGGGSVTEDEMRKVAARGGVDPGVVRALDAESLVQLLSSGGEVDPTRAWVMAELMYLEALAAETAGATVEAFDLYAKSLRLYTALDPRIIGGIHEAVERMDEIEKRMEALRPTAADPNALGETT